MKKRIDTLDDFAIETAIKHALTLNEEADNANTIILSCGYAAWLKVLQMWNYAELLDNRHISFPSQRTDQYPGTTGAIYFEGTLLLVLPDSSLADKVFVIHDEDYQWSVSATVDDPFEGQP